MQPVRLVWIDASDPLMAQVNALRHEVLFAPFGIERDDRWDDEGADRLHLVALAGGEVVGYTCLVLEPYGTGHLRQVSVRGDVRRRGLGAALVAEAEAEARRRGIGLVWLNARRSAEGFYHRLGYATTSDVFSSGRTNLPHVRMEKRLADR